jgi:hypothetical protein
MPAGEPHAAVSAYKTELAGFVIAESEAQSLAKLRAESANTLAGAFERGVIRQADEAGTALIIAVGDDIIHGADLLKKAVKLATVSQRVPHPDKMPVVVICQAQERIGDGAILEVVTAFALGRAGVVNVAQDGEGVSHGKKYPRTQLPKHPKA